MGGGRLRFWGPIGFRTDFGSRTMGMERIHEIRRGAKEINWDLHKNIENSKKNSKPIENHDVTIHKVFIYMYI